MDLLKRFDERSAEVVTYIAFLEGVDAAVQSGIPTIGGPDGARITTQQQRILYAGVYLQLYNLVEATITSCLDAVSKASMESASWMPGDLSVELRAEWVRFLARTDVEMKPEKRLESALDLCDHLVESLPVSPFEIAKGGGGNWDDVHIEKVAKRLGCKIKLPKSVREAVKRPIRDDLGALGLIVSLRNKLAHGSLSFAECGQNDTPDELSDLTKAISSYLKIVASTFQKYIEDYQYVRTEKRPDAGVAA